MVLVVLGVACASGPLPRETRLPLVRRARPEPIDEGPAREVTEAKGELLRVINEERRAHGAGPVAWDPLGARVGDLFCRDSARDRYVSHWDLAGRAPYRRWTDAGGFDYHAQNVGSVSVTGAPIQEPLARLLLGSHAEMMAEVPPDDGHRRTVLDPIWTHVGIGAAIVGGEFRMTEEYSRRVAEWVETPEGPFPGGTQVPLHVKLPAGWNAGAVEIGYEPPLRPLGRDDVNRRNAYRYPEAIRSFRPLLGAGFRWSDGDRGDFPTWADGRLRLSVPLTSGPGSYYVLVFAAEGNVDGKKLSPVTVLRLDAR